MTRETKNKTLSDFRFGQMNPLEDALGRQSFDPSRVRVASTMQSSNIGVYLRDLLKGKRDWNAIIFRSTAQPGPHAASAFQRSMTSFNKGSATGPHYVYKIFLAELDCFKKLPIILTGPKAEENLINILRDATAPMGKNWGPLDYGTPVKVVFHNQEKGKMGTIVNVHYNRRIPLQGEDSAAGLFKNVAVAQSSYGGNYTQTTTVGGAGSRSAVYIPTGETVQNAQMPSHILIDVNINGTTIKILKDMEADLMGLKKKYEEAFPGSKFRVSNSYRDYATQKRLYDCWRRKQGGENNDCNLAAAPGTSRHGWGAAVDLDSTSMFGAGSYATKTKTLKFRWLNRYGEDYNFIFNVNTEAWHMGWTGTSKVLRGVRGNLVSHSKNGRPEGPATMVVKDIIVGLVES